MVPHSSLRSHAFAADALPVEQSDAEVLLNARAEIAHLAELLKQLEAADSRRRVSAAITTNIVLVLCCQKQSC